MDIQTQYSTELFGRYYLFNTVYKNGKYYWTNLFPAGMFLCAVYALRKGQNGLVILAVAMGLLSPFLIRRLIQLLIRMQLKASENLSGREIYRLSITSAGVTVGQGDTQTAQFGWKQLWRVYQVQDAYYLYSDSRHAYIAPTGALSPEEHHCLQGWMEAGLLPGRLRCKTNLTVGIQRWFKHI